MLYCLKDGIYMITTLSTSFAHIVRPGTLADINTFMLAHYIKET